MSPPVNHLCPSEWLLQCCPLIIITPLGVPPRAPQVLDGEKVGIVGRTGSGKSSLVVALFRLVEPYRGQLLLDGQQLLQMGVRDVRKAIAAIPQEPVCVGGVGGGVHVHCVLCVCKAISVPVCACASGGGYLEWGWQGRTYVGVYVCAPGVCVCASSSIHVFAWALTCESTCPPPPSP